MSKWWQQDMSDASQGMYSDPATAVQLATLPIQVMTAQQQQQAEQAARDARGGLMKNIMGAASDLGHGLDGALSHVPGWGITKDVGKAAWYPVDKTASGAYWLYSNGVSQPLSTLFIMTATGQGSGTKGADSTSYFSAHDWANAWHKANNISPAQVVLNYENTTRASGTKTLFNNVLGQGAANLSKQEKDNVARQQDRFLYDTDYWRNKQGWTYTAGTGTLDFLTSVGIDPTYAGLKTVSAGIKGVRSIRVATEATENAKGLSAFNQMTDKFSKSITAGLSKTPDQATRSENVNKFFDWTEGKSPAEIAQHPIWGVGRRKNPATEQLSQILANADEVEKPMIMRFAMGDNTAAQQLAMKNGGLLAQIGRMSDNRQLVDSVKFDPDLFAHFMGEERAGRVSPAANLGGPSIGGTSSAQLGNRLVEAPYPRPTTPGPRQAGWDATYGALQKKANVYRQSVGDILASGNGVRPMAGTAAGTTLADQLRFSAWKAGQLDSLNVQIATAQQKADSFGNMLGGALTHPEEFSPGQANLFGTVKSLYRMGPARVLNTEKSADRSWKAATVDRYGRSTEGNFASRVLQKGYYTVPLRIVQSFGDQLPQTLVDHNAPDASTRVLDMLKRVPGLGQDLRGSMVAAYSSAPDKIAKSNVLAEINRDVVSHLSAGKNLSPDVARAISEMIETGKVSTMNKLTGKSIPNQQEFSAAVNPLTGHRADMIEDGEGWIVAPQAKTQLQYTEPLLDVNELGRFLDRNSGFLSSIKKSGGDVRDAVMSVADSASNIWKAATLLRPGYILRAPSEEMAASAIKFGMMSSIMSGAHGGVNWALNRGQQLKAVVGAGSYASATGGGTRIKILDPAMKQLSKELIGKTSRINVSDAWPVVMQRIDDEREAMTALQKRIDVMKKDPDHDPGVLAGLRDDLADHQDVIDEHTDYAHELLRNATDAKGRRLGEATIEHRGIEVPQAFSQAWDNPIPRDQISSDVAMHTLFQRGQAIDTERLIKTGSWTSVTKDDPNYWDSLLNALNHQWAQDDLFKRVAGDMSLNDAADWLKTPAGKLHMSQLGPAARDQERLLSGIKATLEQYTAKNPVLLDRISKGINITEADVRKAIAHDDLPVVHGEEVKGLTAKSNHDTAAGVIDRVIEKGFRRLGTIPTDLMSRHPTYIKAQEARMRQLMDEELSYQKSVGKSGDTLDAKALNQMLKKSDTMARKDISQIVYDPTRTTATEALRFVAPFMSAQIDGLERWGGLIAEKPQFLGNAAKIYNAPVAANLVTDSEGNAVDENGYAIQRDANGKITGKKFVGIQDRTIHFKLPTGSSYKPGGYEVPIKIQALNTILPGDPWWNPGAGPVVSVAASKIAENYPGMGDFLQWAKILPYGPQGFMDNLTPAYIKNVWNAFDPNSEKYQQATLAEYQRQAADYANGDGPAPDINSAKKNAGKFMFLKALTSWMSPAQTQTTPLTGTPYQFYVDQYKKMEQVDPKNADANFLQRYGQDYFMFTASLNKSIGIAPTLSALNTAKEYKDLIAGDPSLAPFIIGDVYNKGAFSSSAYYDEKNMTIGGQQVRGTQSVEDALQDSQRRLGWQQYGKYMDAIDAGLIRAGFTSYTQSGAEGYQALKQQMTDSLKTMYPAWEEDFDTTDKGAVPRRIQSFEILANDPRLANDPMRQDIPALRQYLAGRQIFQQMLRAAGGRQLSFNEAGQAIGDNAALAQSWRQFQMYLVQSNTKFASVFNRYLANDNLQ